jgi:hypothetical protein
MRTILAITVGLGLLLALSPASLRADSVTFTGQPLGTIPEDGLDHQFVFKLTDFAAGLITNIAAVVPSNFSTGTGDPNDKPQFTFAISSCPTLSLQNGGMCTFVLDILPGNGNGETDGDSWQGFLQIGASYTIPAGTRTSSLLDSQVTVADPLPTPEPSSVILLGTGLLGLAPLLRRKREIGVRRQDKATLGSTQ